MGPFLCYVKKPNKEEVMPTKFYRPEHRIIAKLGEKMCVDEKIDLVSSEISYNSR
jgi:hypothetical protein